MRWLDRLERRIGWLAFPGLFRCYVLLGVLAFGLSWVRPDLGAILEFDRARILHGEPWRLVTFLFAPDALGRPGVIQVVLLYFAVVIGFLINDSLETAWGVFSTSLFLYCGMLMLVLGNLLLPAAALSGELFYLSAFFAFATLHPRHQFLVFFVLPLQVRYIALLGAASLAFSAVSHPLLVPFYLLAFANYLLWILPGFLASRKPRPATAATTARRPHPGKDQRPAATPFHQCSVCDRTEHDPARLEFRVGRDGREYCLDHLDHDGRAPDRPHPTPTATEPAGQGR